MSFLEAISLVTNLLNIKESLGRLAQNPEKKKAEQYVVFLEAKNVLHAPIDYEVRDAVIKSMEAIKEETEKFRLEVSDTVVRKQLLSFIRSMSEELQNIWAYDPTNRNGQSKMFMALVRFRIEASKALAVLCHAYGIDPKSSELKHLILNSALVKPRSTRGA